MDLVFTSSDFQNIVADVTVTYHFPADVGAFTPPLISPLDFAKSAESRKKYNIFLCSKAKKSQLYSFWI